MGAPFTFKIHRAGGLSLYSNTNKYGVGFSQNYHTIKTVPKCHIAGAFQIAVSTSPDLRKVFKAGKSKINEDAAVVKLGEQKFILKKKKNPRFFDELARILDHEMTKK
jgi:hypothetical protein